MKNIIKSEEKLTASTYILRPDFKKQLDWALPKHMNANRMVRLVLTELRRTPRLKECDALSFCGAIIQSAQLGLEPGNNLGHAYLLPYGNECQLIIGYRGMLDLARRSGQLMSIQSNIVYENDFFEFEYGLSPKLKHIPARKERGNIIYVYCCASLKDGASQFEVMSIEDVNKIKISSKSSNNGPWKTHPEEMARKTAIRRVFKYLPISIEMAQAITLDEAAERGDQNNRMILDDPSIIEGEYLTPAQDETYETLSQNQGNPC